MSSIQRVTKKLSYVLHFHRHIGRAGVWIGDLLLHNSCTIRQNSRADPDRITGFSMDNVLGLLRIRVKRGVNLVVRDAVSNSSDPYVVVALGEQVSCESVNWICSNPKFWKGKWNFQIWVICDYFFCRNWKLALWRKTVTPCGMMNLLSPFTMLLLRYYSYVYHYHYHYQTIVLRRSIYLSFLPWFCKSVQTVYDKDTLTGDDKMGDAEFDLKLLLDCHNLGLSNLPTPTTISRVQAMRNNCLADESLIVWKDGKIVQDMILRLRNVESGEVEIQIEWIQIPNRTWIQNKTYPYIYI